MGFVRYLGKGSNLTRNRIYPIESSGIGDSSIIDDTGCRFTFNSNNDYSFERYFPIVYASLSRPVWPGSYAGQVLLLDDYSDDGMFKSIDSDNKSRYISRDNVIIIDSSRICIGFYVKALDTGLWQPIEAFNESMWLQTRGSNVMRSPMDYSLSVFDGKISCIRIVMCINDSGLSDLVSGNYYLVTHEDGEFVSLDGYSGSFDYDRFKFPDKFFTSG